jgi:hypothetical protein
MVVQTLLTGAVVPGDPVLDQEADVVDLAQDLVHDVDLAPGKDVEELRARASLGLPPDLEGSVLALEDGRLALRAPDMSPGRGRGRASPKLLEVALEVDPSRRKNLLEGSLLRRDLLLGQDLNPNPHLDPGLVPIKRCA